MGFASCFASQGTRSGVPTPGSEGLSDQRSRFYLTTRSVAALAVRQGRDRWPPPLLGAGFSDRTRMLSFFAFDLRETSGSSESRGLLGVQRTPRSLAPRSYLSCSSERGLKGSSAHATQRRAHLTSTASPIRRRELRCVDHMPSRSWSYWASSPYPVWSPGSRCTCPPTVASRARHASVCCAMILASLLGLTLAVYLISITETFIAAFALVYSSPKRSEVSTDPPDQRPTSTCRMKDSPRAAADAIMQCRQLYFV